MTNELPKTQETFQLPSTTIDEAIADASLSSAPTKVMKNFSVRLPVELQQAAQFICERHGTELGTFLRSCTRMLVRDYGLKTDEE